MSEAISNEKLNEVENEEKASSSSEDSDSDDENGEVEVNNIEPSQSLATTRSRRANAGSKLSQLLDAEEGVDDFYKTAYGGFDDTDDDEEFDADENEAEDIVDSDFDIDETQDPGQDEATAEAEAAATEIKEQNKKTLSYRDPKAKRNSQKAKKAQKVDENTSKSSLALALEAATNSTEIFVPSTSKAIKKEKPKLDKPTPKVPALKSYVPIAKNLRDSTKKHSKEVKDMLVKRNRQQARQKAKLRQKKAQQAGERVPKTQEEMLEEAKKTEIDNLRSLEEYRNAEVEKVKRNKATSRNLNNLPMIRHRSWIVEVDDEEENNEPTSKKRKVIRSCVTFPDDKTKSKYFPTNEAIEMKSKALERALSVPDRMCIVRSCMAKYLDPLSGLPYSDETAFKYIRTHYVKYLADEPQLKDHPIVKAFLAQTNEKHSQIMLNSEGRIHSVKTPIAFKGSAANVKHALVVVNKMIPNKANTNNNQDNSNQKASIVPIAVTRSDINGKNPFFITQIPMGANKQNTSVVAIAVSSSQNTNEMVTDSQASAITTTIPTMSTANNQNIRIVTTSKGANALQTPLNLSGLATPLSSGSTFAATNLAGGQLFQFQYLQRAPGSQITMRPAKPAKRSISTPIVRNTTVSVTPTSVSLLGQMPPRTLPSSSPAPCVVGTAQQPQSQPMTIMAIPMSTTGPSSAASSSVIGQQSSNKTMVFSANSSNPSIVLSTGNILGPTSGITKAIIKSVSGNVVGGTTIAAVANSQQAQTFQIQRNIRSSLTSSGVFSVQRNSMNGRRLFLRPKSAFYGPTLAPIEAVVTSGAANETTLIPANPNSCDVISDGPLQTSVSSGSTSNTLQVSASKILSPQTIKISSVQQQDQPPHIVLNPAKSLVTSKMLSLPVALAAVSSAATTIVGTSGVSSSSLFMTSATTSSPSSILANTTVTMTTLTTTISTTTSNVFTSA